MAQNWNTGKPIEIVNIADAFGNIIVPVGVSTGTTVANPSLDAFGRQRVSEPFTLGDYKHIYAIDPNFINYTIAGAGVTYNVNRASATLSTGTGATSRCVHQTKFYHAYQPGKSQTILSSFVFGAGQTSVTKRTGYFDDNNGIYFEAVTDNAGVTTLNWVIRSYTSGVADETGRRIPQSQWNIDKCDGTGQSGFNIDITKSQLIFTDFQWLGVGRVRCGFIHNGLYIEAHEFYNSNVLNKVYLSSPNLPVRCEILNTAVGTGGSMEQICSTVLSEGGYLETGIDWAITSPNLRQVGLGSTIPALAIRLKNTFFNYSNRMIVRPGNLNVFSTAENIKYELIKIPYSSYVQGGSWVSVDNNSGIEYNASATGTGNTYSVLDGGFVSAGQIGNGSNSSNLSTSASSNPASTSKKNLIVQNYDSTDSEVYCVKVTSIGTTNTTSVGISLQWREVY
jgi:hypothetical protein